MNATPVSAVEAFGFVIVNLSVERPPGIIDVGVKLLAIPGGAGVVTSSDALALLPLPPFVEVTFELLLTLVPVVVPVTVTEKLQTPPPAMFAPESAMLVAVVVSVPPH